MKRRPSTHLDPALQDYVDGVFCEGLDLLHAAVIGDHVTVRRIVARAVDLDLLTFVIAVMAGRALNNSGRPGPLLADLADRIDNPEHDNQGENS